MSAQAAITLNDGAGTPVAHIFEPNGAFSSSEGVIKTSWIDRLGHALEIGRAVIREDHRPSTNGSRERIRDVIEVPVVETVSGVPTKTRMHVVDIEVRFDPGAAQIERDHVAAYAKNFVASIYFQTKIKTGERTW